MTRKRLGYLLDRTGKQVAVTHAKLARSRVLAIARAIATRCRGPVRVVSNPTLVHHGLAKSALWHLYFPPSRPGLAAYPVADLYTGTATWARGIARMIADATQQPVAVAANRDALRLWSRHQKEAAHVKPGGVVAHERRRFGINPRSRTKRSRPKRRRANPATAAELDQARKTFHRWHQFAPSDVTVHRGARSIPRVLVKLGEIPEIIYRSNKWEGRLVTYTHKTKAPRPLLCTGADGKGLFIVGGKTRPTARGLVD